MQTAFNGKVGIVAWVGEKNLGPRIASIGGACYNPGVGGNAYATRSSSGIETATKIYVVNEQAFSFGEGFFSAKEGELDA